MKKIQFILIIVFIISEFCSAQIGGYALFLDGTSNSVEFSSTSDITLTNFSVEAWIKTTATTGEQEIFAWAKRVSYGHITEFRVSNGKLQLGINDGTWASVTSSSSVNSGNWIHVAVTKESSSVKLYINGKLDASATISKNPVENQIEIGYMQDDGNKRNFFPGTIDEVRIWTSVRSESDIKANMFKELLGNETGFYAYYKMSDGSGTTLSDNQTNVTAKTGTINGAVWKASGCFAGPKNCLNFDGVDDYISLPASFGSAFNSLQRFSFCGWVYMTNLNTNTWGTFFSVHNYYAPYGRVTFHQLPNSHSAGYDDILISISQNTSDLYGEAYTTSNVLELNKWIHLAFVYDGTATGNSNRLKFYVNGKLVSLTFPYNIPSAFASSFDRYYMARHANPDYFKGGKFDEFSFWNVSLSESQIRNIMMKSLVGNETGLFAYFRFEHSDGTTLYDNTANGRNGTLTNMNTSISWVSSDAFNTWLGSESNSWSTAANWSRGIVPASTDNIGIYKWTLGNDVSLSGTPTLNHMFFSSTSSPTLNSSLTVNGELFLERDIDLNGNTITLGSSGNINEGSYRFYGTSGTITTTRTLSNITALNVGGLGATITTSANMGSTTITRGHTTQGGSLSISRYYNITPTNNSGLNATFVFNYNDNELNGNTESDLKLFKSTDGGANWILQSSSIVNISANTITLTGLSGFSLWTAANSSSPMPVELVSFTSNVNERNVTLNWKTNKETNNKGFEIERKDLQSSWLKVGYVEGKGNINEITAYVFYDTKLKSGKYNYRLKQIDFNGIYTYHNLNGTVEIGIPSKFALSQNYPNPFNPSTKIEFHLPEDEYVILKVYDVSGKEVSTLVNEKLQAGFYSIPFSINQFSNYQISSGVYFYKLSSEKFNAVKKMIVIK